MEREWMAYCWTKKKQKQKKKKALWIVGESG